MAARSLKLAFVMDPVESEDFGASTTIILMLEAQRRGHEVFYVDPADLRVASGKAVAEVTPVRLSLSEGGQVEKGPSRQLILDEEVDIALQRVDPPVDAAYITATQILGLCRKTRVINHPKSVLAYNEKLFALHFADLMPETSVSREIRELERWLDEMGGEMIIKPLDGKGGEGIFHLTRDDRNLSSILEQATHFGQRPVMAQRYLPGIREGDKRILLLDGEPLGAVLRVPDEGEVRANFHAGGRARVAGLDERDIEIISRLSPTLQAEGLFFVGIDVIGGCLTEINVTSPTGLQEINALDGVRLEENVLDGLEAQIGGA
jgi:glutathione synthase